MRRWMILGLSLSLAAHVGIGVSIASIPKDVVTKHSLVSVFEKKKPKKEEKKEALKDEPPPPPPKAKEPPRAAPKPKAVVENTPPPPPANTPPPSAAHPQLAALPNLGISMAGGPGGGVGIAVPMPQAEAPGGDAPRTVEGTAPKPKPKDDCPEDAVKPKYVAGSIPLAGIIAASRAAGGIEGRMRIPSFSSTRRAASPPRT